MPPSSFHGASEGSWYTLMIDSVPVVGIQWTASSHIPKCWLNFCLKISSDWGSRFFTRNKDTPNSQSIHLLTNPWWITEAWFTDKEKVCPLWTRPHLTCTSLHPWKYSQAKPMQCLKHSYHRRKMTCSALVLVKDLERCTVYYISCPLLPLVL